MFLFIGKNVIANLYQNLVHSFLLLLWEIYLLSNAISTNFFNVFMGLLIHQEEDKWLIKKLGNFRKIRFCPDTLICLYEVFTDSTVDHFFSRKGFISRIELF